MITKFKDNKTIDSSLIIYNQRRMNKIIDGLMQELEDGTATGESISVTDSANALAKLLPSGRTEQDYIIPIGYTALEYIQSTGTQYIDTGYIPNSNTKMEILAQYPVIGADSNWGNKAFSMANGPFSFSNLALNFQSSQDKNLIILENGKIETSLGKRTFTANEFQAEYNLVLFGINRNGNVIEKSSRCKIYYLKLWENDVLVRDFIPVKNSNNVAGLYDLVGETFYANSGTGEFVASEEGNPIHVVKGHNEFLVQSRNLFPTHKIRTDLDWLTVNEDGSVTIVYESGSNINFTNIFKEYIFIPKGNYKLKLFVEGTFKGGNLLVHNGEKQYSEIPIRDNNVGTISNDTIGNLEFYLIQAGTNCTIRFELEEGTEIPTKYFLHEEQTLELDLPEGMEMCGIGDYADTFEKVDEKWYKNEKVHKYISDGSENITTYNSYQLAIFGIQTNFEYNVAICNKYVLRSNAADGNYSIIPSWNKKIQIRDDRFVENNVGNVTAFKNDLADNNLLMYYVERSQVSTYIEITDPLLISQLDKMQKILSHFGGTTITTITAGDLKSILNLSYKKSNRLKDKEQDARLDNIENKLALLES